MDNLTHTLAGLLIGEGISRLAARHRASRPPREQRGLLLALSVVASNLPDADLAYTLAEGSKLAYLSQHRGYTHTLLGLLAAAAIMLAAAELWLRRRGPPPAPPERTAIAAAVGVSLLAHVALDATNNYGVHPFWPLHNRWLYGDAVFIVEPLLWTCAAPLLFLLRSRPARALIALVLLAALALSFGTRWILPASGLGLAALMLLLLYAGWKMRAAAALACALAAWMAVTGTFFAAGAAAGRRLAAELPRQVPGAALLDHVLTPMPANPACWNAIAVLLDGEHYVLRRAVLSAAPGLIAATACPDRTLDQAATAPLRRLSAPPSAAVQWLDEYRAPRADLARVLRSYCEAAAFMRFARAPWLAERAGVWTAGDLRYDREPGLGFAELDLGGPSSGCPAAPPWNPPRPELLPR